MFVQFQEIIDFYTYLFLPKREDDIFATIDMDNINGTYSAVVNVYNGRNILYSPRSMDNKSKYYGLYCEKYHKSIETAIDELHYVLVTKFSKEYLTYKNEKIIKDIIK